MRRVRVRFKLCVNAPQDFDDLSSVQLRELVVLLLGKVAALEPLVGEQRAEIARLKGLNGPPTIKPSGMDKATEPAKPDRPESRPRRGKVRPRVRIEERVLKAAAPAGSRFKGYETYLVQDLVLSVRAIRYLRERWVTPDGRTIVAPLPEGTKGHFGPDLRRFVLMQYHQGQTTLPRLTALLHAVGLSISKREIQRLLTEKQDGFLDGWAQETATDRDGQPRRAARGTGDIALGLGRRHGRTAQSQERLLHTDWQRLVHLVRHTFNKEPAEFP